MICDDMWHVFIKVVFHYFSKESIHVVGFPNSFPTGTRQALSLRLRETTQDMCSQARIPAWQHLGSATSHAKCQHGNLHIALMDVYFNIYIYILYSYLFPYHPLMQSKLVGALQLVRSSWPLYVFFASWQLLTWFVFSWRSHVIVLTLSCGWMVLLLSPLLTVLFEENQMKAIQKLRSTTTQLENCLSGALELEHLEPPEDMVMDPARAKFQALGSASPKAGCAQVLYFYGTVSSLRAIRWRCPHVPSMSPNGRIVFKRLQ